MVPDSRTAAAYTDQRICAGAKMLRWACRFCDSNTGPAVIILVDVSSAFSWFGRESNQNDNSTASIYLTEFALDRVQFSKVYPNLAPPSYKFPPFLFSHSQWVTPLSSSESICPRQCLTNLSGRNNWHPPAGRALYLKWWKLYCISSKLNGFRSIIHFRFDILCFWSLPLASIRTIWRRRAT